MNVEKVCDMTYGVSNEPVDDVDTYVINKTPSETNTTKTLLHENCASVSTTDQDSFACDICSKVFQKKCYLRQHLRIHNKEDCVCKLCNKVLNHKQALFRHLQLHKIKGFACDICSKVFQRKSYLKTHLHIHNKEDCVCKLCNKVLSHKLGLHRHLLLHKTEKVKCEVCDKSFSSRSTVKQHHRQCHTNERKYSCEICCKAFKTLSTLQKHYLTHTKEKPFSCEFCNKGFTNRGALNIHLLTHPQSSVNRESHTCEICNRSFQRKYQLNTHMFRHIEERPYVCEICNKSFRDFAYLKIHLNAHRGIKRKKGKRQTCGTCNKTMSNSAFYSHMKIHLNERNHICHICDKAFLKNCDLQIHIKTHIGDRPFSCEICEKRFTRKSHVKTHLQTHMKPNCKTKTATTKQTFLCEICKRTFPNELSLTKHLHIHVIAHSNNSGFSCIICGQRFIERQYVVWHMLAHNKKAVTPDFSKNFDEKQNIETIGIGASKNNLPITDDNHESQIMRYFCQKWNLKERNSGACSGNNSFGWELCKESFATESELKVHCLSHTYAHSFSAFQNYINGDQATEWNLNMLESMSFCKEQVKSTVWEKQVVETICDEQHMEIFREESISGGISDEQNTQLVSERQNTKCVSEVPITELVCEDQTTKGMQRQETLTLCEKQNTKSAYDEQFSENISGGQDTENVFKALNTMMQDINTVQKQNKTACEKHSTKDSSERREEKFVGYKQVTVCKMHEAVDFCNKLPNDTVCQSEEAMPDLLNTETPTMRENKEGLQMRYACHICNKKFSQRMHVQMHLFTHIK